jgi:hypothetical protein
VTSSAACTGFARERFDPEGAIGVGEPGRINAEAV